METPDLYDLADQENIAVDYFHLPRTISCSIEMFDGSCAIALDPQMITSAAEEKTCLAHELGHCCTGSFYTRKCPYQIRGQAEYRADRWAVLRLLPFNQLKYAIRILDIKKPYELAEYFCVTEALIHKAFDVYRRMGTKL